MAELVESVNRQSEKLRNAWAVVAAVGTLATLTVLNLAHYGRPAKALPKTPQSVAEAYVDVNAYAQELMNGHELGGHKVVVTPAGPAAPGQPRMEQFDLSLRDADGTYDSFEVIGEVLGSGADKITKVIGTAEAVNTTKPLKDLVSDDPGLRKRLTRTAGNGDTYIFTWPSSNGFASDVITGRQSGPGNQDKSYSGAYFKLKLPGKQPKYVPLSTALSPAAAVIEAQNYLGQVEQIMGPLEDSSGDV